MPAALHRRLAIFGSLILLSLPGCSGCNSHAPPRTRDDIFQDQISVETLYFTEDGTELLAPGSTRGMIVDESSGKLAFAAWQCNNEECPGRSPDGQPHLFPLPDPFAYVDDGGEPAIRQPETQEDFKRFEEFIDRKCPECGENQVTYHITPAAKERLAELEVEMREYMQRNQMGN